jgi:hypothetical protein
MRHIATVTKEISTSVPCVTYSPRANFLLRLFELLRYGGSVHFVKSNFASVRFEFLLPFFVSRGHLRA